MKNIQYSESFSSKFFRHFTAFSTVSKFNFRRLPFKRQENVFDGQVCVEPRLSCWYGEHSYSYNPLLKHEATPIDKWPSILKQILSQIKTDPNIKQLFPSINLNSVLCNLYRNGPTYVHFLTVVSFLAFFFIRRG